jgi:DNA-binding transcriptional LysR family regulator
MDPLDGVAAFARVVEAGSFSAAARRLRISKSATSAHVQRLEERLGVRLLQRTTRRISLTEAGAVYYRHCPVAELGGRGRPAVRSADAHIARV